MTPRWCPTFLLGAGYLLPREAVSWLLAKADERTAAYRARGGAR